MSQTNRGNLQEIWAEKIMDFKESGKTRPEWCALNDESVHRLRYWLRKYKKINEQSKAQWMSIRLDEYDPVAANGITIKIGKAAVEVKPGTDRQLLLDVLRTINSL